VSGLFGGVAAEQLIRVFIVTAAGGARRGKPGHDHRLLERHDLSTLAITAFGARGLAALGEVAAGAGAAAGEVVSPARSAFAACGPKGVASAASSPCAPP